MSTQPDPTPTTGEGSEGLRECGNARHLRPHATFGDDPSGYCGCADDDGCVMHVAHPAPEVDDRVGEHMCPGVVYCDVCAGLTPATPDAGDASEGLGLIYAERQRQIDGEGYSRQHDYAHGSPVLSRAARCYEIPNNTPDVPDAWPWESDAWKPKGLVRNLVRAGALYLAARDVAPPLGMDRARAQEGLDRCVAALDEIAARVSAAATKARAEGAAEALREAADALVWVRPEKTPCDNPESCCGSEGSCDAMRPVVRVVGEQWLRDRAARIARSDAAPDTGGDT